MYPLEDKMRVFGYTTRKKNSSVVYQNSQIICTPINELPFYPNISLYTQKAAKERKYTPKLTDVKGGINTVSNNVETVLHRHGPITGTAVTHDSQLCAVVLFVIGPALAAFNPINDCPARNQNCHCQSTSAIECRRRNLHSIPLFQQHAYAFGQLQLDENYITQIKQNAFLQINVSEIYLSDNQINIIEPDSFNGLKDWITVLDLAKNQLIALPDEIGKLNKLEMLDVSDNPIRLLGFRDPVLRHLGDFLKEFRFGDKVLEAWPSSLHHLQALQTLKFYGGNADMDNIPIDAFHSFEFTLTKLWIQNTSLISTPIALQYLKSINELHFDNNLLVGDAGILIPAFAGMTHQLQTLSLKNNNLTTFPPALVTLEGLHNLSLAGNSLEFVSDQAVVRVVSDLLTLDLTNCDLDRIPGALSKLRHLQNLDLSHNHLTTIEKNDLQHMQNLMNLDVSFNPLQYVSKSTFYNLTKLATLSMHETNLYNVPEALKNLPKLANLDLSSQFPSIECNCDLSWLYCYQVSHTNLTIAGQCETVSMSISEYVAKKIRQICSPTCP